MSERAEPAENLRQRILALGFYHNILHRRTPFNLQPRIVPVEAIKVAIAVSRSGGLQVLGIDAVFGGPDLFRLFYGVDPGTRAVLFTPHGHKKLSLGNYMYCRQRS